MFLPLLFEDIAFSEIIVIMLVVLLFFGAKSIPGIAKTLGKTLYEFRNAQAELQREIQKSGMDMKKDLNITELIKETGEELIQPLDQVATEINNTVEFKAMTTNGNPVNEIELQSEIIEAPLEDQTGKNKQNTNT